MTGRSFYDHVHAHPELEWLGVFEGSVAIESEAVVWSNRTGYRYAITIRSIVAQPWAELEAMLLGDPRRPPEIMRHMTRIVGYYSSLWNWNPSALARLRDRHRGNYTVPEAA
jgi:hypothetical protein